MAKCPSTNTEEWKILKDEVGTEKADEIWEMNNRELPSKEEIPKWIKPYKEQERQLKELDKKDILNDILNNLDNNNVEKLLNQEGYINTETGEKYDKRVSALVAEYARKYNLEYKGTPEPFYGKKGTVIHRYMEELGKSIAEGNDPSLSEVQEQIFKLRELDRFADEKESFFRMSPKQFKQLKRSVRDFINSIKEIQRAEIDPEGNVEFRFEVPIADDTRDVAGTVDMIAIFSDGTAGIYDFKTFSRPGRQPPGQKAINRWNVQLINYKNILKDNYGISKFRQSRAIPIQTSYSGRDKSTGKYIQKINEGFQTVTMQNNKNVDSLDHLDPIPVEELTGDENLDRLVDRLIREKRQTEELYNQAKNQDRTRLLNKLSRINNALTNIQLNRDISSMIRDVITLYDRYEDRLYLGQTDANYMTDKELADALGEMDLYSNLIQDYRTQLDHLKGDKKKKVGEMLGRAANRADYLEGQIMEVIKGRLGKEVTKPGEHVGFFARNFSGIEDWNIPAFQRLSDLVRMANENRRRESKIEFEKIDEVDEAFSEWADQNGYSQIGKFDLIYNEDTGNLVRKYDNEFWERRYELRDKARSDEGLTKKEKEWLKDHFKFDKERYNKRKQLVFDNINHRVEYGNITEEQASRRRENFLKRNSIEKNAENFYSSTYLTPKDSGNEQYLSEEWKFIQSHEPVKDYYEMYLDYNKRWTEEFGHETIGRHFVPNVKRRLVDQVIEQGATGAFSFFENVQKQHQIHQQDEIGGARDSNGNPLTQVPLMYTDPVKTPLKDSQKEQIRAEVEADVEITYERGTEEFENEVQRRITKKEYEKGREVKSKDLTRSLKAMVYSASNYRHKNEIEGEVMLLQALIQNEQVESKEITEQDQTAIRESMGDVVKKMGLDPTMEEAFQQFVDMMVYDKELQSDKVWFNKYSRNKVIKSLMNFLSVRALGLNTTIQAADFIQGKSSLWMMAKENRYFGTDDYKNTVSQFASKDDNLKNLVEYFEPQARSMRAEDIEFSGSTWTSRRATQRSLFIGYAWSDDNISTTILGAMSKRYIVDDDGQIKNPKIDNDIINEDAPTVYESMEVNEDGKPVISGLSKEEFVDFRAKVQKMSNRIRGTITEQQRALMTNSILGQALMQFRSWMPGLATARFGTMKYDQTMESFEIGRFNVAMGEVIGTGMLPNMKEVMKLSAEVVSMGLYKKEVNTDNIKRQMNAFLTRNPEYKGKFDPNNPEEFISLIRDKLNGFVAEMRVYLAFLVLTQLLASLGWDEIEEEDRPTSNIFTYEANQIARRALLEASFWYSPSSVDEIVKSPIALWGVTREITNILDNSIVEASYAVKGERNPRDKTPFGYYMLRNTPVANQVLEIFNFFDEYNPPKTTFERVLSDPDGDDE